MGSSARLSHIRLSTIIVLLMILSSSEAAETIQTPTGTALSCLLRLRADPRNSCIPEEENLLPDRLSELVESPETPEEFQEAAKRNDLSTVSAARMADVPLPILLLLPLNHLSACEPRALSAIVRRYPTNTAVARRVAAALDLQDNVKRRLFIREIGTSSALSYSVQAAIGEAVVRWWRPELEGHATSDEDDIADLAAVGSPLLAALPPGFLAELTPERASHFLSNLRTHRWKDRSDWCFQPFITRRVWMVIFKGDGARGFGQLTTPESEGLNMLWAGATPDEIADLQFEPDDKPSLLKLSKLTKLQVRGLLSQVFPSGNLMSTDLNDVASWVQDLSPSNLQRFPINVTDFSLFASAPLERSSLPTQKQILEDVLASDIAQGRIASRSGVGMWGRNLKDIGRLAHLIRASHLSNYSLHRLPLDVLAALDSNDLSSMQARYLTRNGEFVDLRMPLADLDKLHGLTRAIPTGQLAELREAGVQPGVLLHLLEALPAVHPARSASLFNKLRPKMHEAEVFLAMLRNPSPSQYFNLVSARELASERTWLESAFKFPKSRASSSPSTELNDRLRFVPDFSLSAILASARREIAANLIKSSRLPWTVTSLLSNSRPLIQGSLLGLTCPDVLGIELVDLPAILYAYHQRRRESGFAFPKQLQHCIQRSLEDYLDMKQRINQIFPEDGLVSLLEPNDIDAFGGYVLSTLTIEHIREAKHSDLILATIGALTPHELLAAVPNLQRLEELASLLVDISHARSSLRSHTLFTMGNLHMFLPAGTISVMEPSAWKLFVESNAGSARSLVMCASAEQRDAWHRLAVAAFGEADKWSAGVLAAMGDLLAAMPADVLREIRVTSWRDAADTLAMRTAYHFPVEVPGIDHTKPFVEVCKGLLPEGDQMLYEQGVRRLLRYYMRASQDLLDTVVPADQLVRRLQQRSFRAHTDWAPPVNFPAPSFPSPPSPSINPDPETTTTTTVQAPSTAESTRDSSTRWWDSLFADVEKTSTTEPRDSETTTTSTADNFMDWDSFFSTHAPWIPSSQGTVANPPDTVFVHDDQTTTAWPMTPQTNTSTSLTTTTEGVLAVTEKLPPLKPWGDAASEFGLNESLTRTEAPSSTSTRTTASSDGDINMPRSALGLPPLNDVADKDNATDDLELSPSRRRRDISDDFDTYYELEREVHLQITCGAVRSLGGAAWLAVVPSDADNMLDVEAEDCAEVFSKLSHLDSRFTRGIWNKIPSERRVDLIGDLGSLVGAITEEEIENLNLDLKGERSLDALSVIGEHVKDFSVVSAVAERFAAQNPAAAVQSGMYPDSVLLALGPVACALPLDQLRLLLARRGSLLHAAHNLNEHLPRCNDQCLQELARAAITDAALGPPSNWTAEDVRNMGVIVAGLNEDQLEQLKRPLNEVEQPLSGLTARAITCMTPSQVQVIGDQLSVVSPVAAAAVTEEHRRELNAGQEVELLRVRNLAFTRVLGRRQAGLHEHNPVGGRSVRPHSSDLLIGFCLLAQLLRCL